MSDHAPTCDTRACFRPAASTVAQPKPKQRQWVTALGSFEPSHPKSVGLWSDFVYGLAPLFHFETLVPSRPPVLKLFPFHFGILGTNRSSSFPSLPSSSEESIRSLSRVPSGKVTDRREAFPLALSPRLWGPISPVLASMRVPSSKPAPPPKST